jgi:sugar lactone lactonase YvrE
MATIHLAHRGPDRLGECPLWHPHEQRLYWVDAFAPAIRRLDPRTGTVASFTLACDIGSIAFAHDGSLLGATRLGFQRIVLEGSRASGTVLADPLVRNRRLLLNDGKCDRLGRYWCASLHSDFIGREGELFLLDPDLTVKRIDGGFLVGNGIAFSPDDTRMYLADSRDETVWVYDFDLRQGQASNRRRFFSTANMVGRVDGAACDRDGNYWCALVHGGAVACISPQGRLLERIALPLQHPTMVAFGGDDLDRLYVTSASVIGPAPPDAAEEFAGALLCIEGLGVRGIPEPWFGSPPHEHSTWRFPPCPPP